MITLTKKGLPQSDTVQDQNREDVACDLCNVIYILGYSDGEKYRRLEEIQGRAKSLVNGGHHSGHPDKLPFN